MKNTGEYESLSAVEICETPAGGTS